jgi:hypothetical protein
MAQRNSGIMPAPTELVLDEDPTPAGVTPWLPDASRVRLD